jgi:uncharacterized membrane protein YcaP (DUF421 family)
MTSQHLPFLLAIVVRTTLILIWLFVGLRALGKRHVNPMNVCDLAFLMAMANAVQNAMTAGKGDLSVGVASACALLAAGYILTSLFVRKPKLEERLVGTPTVLIHDGKIEMGQLRREGVSLQELMRALREHDVPDPSDVRLAVLEVDGSLSIVPRD